MRVKWGGLYLEETEYRIQSPNSTVPLNWFVMAVLWKHNIYILEWKLCLQQLWSLVRNKETKALSRKVG